jgi:predicted ATP-grasp superfamily ATP-dependent carboligase
VNDTVLTLSRFSKHLSGYTRLPRGTLRHLDRSEAAETLVDALLSLPVAYPSLLFGVHEDITRFVHTHRDRLRDKYLVPDVQLQKIYDKYAFNTLLPASARIDTRLWSEVDPRAVDCPGLFILKGRQGKAFRWVTGEKALPLDHLTERDREVLFRRIAPDQVILQEVVESDRPVVSVCTFSANGEVAGTFTYEKLRQHPNRFGTGTYLRSTRAPSLERLAQTILQQLDFTGISEIEFIHDRRTGAYKIVEMNPRAWKSVHFATRCGQNLVARYLTFVATGETAPDNGYACDRHWADLATDLPQMLRERRLSTYERGFFECTWEKADPWPSLVLWTLFPLMALEERLALKGLSW